MTEMTGKEATTVTLKGKKYRKGRTRQRKFEASKEASIQHEGNAQEKKGTQTVWTTRVGGRRTGVRLGGRSGLILMLSRCWSGGTYSSNLGVRLWEEPRVKKGLESPHR